MSPVNLAALPSEQPAPVGTVQIKRGVTNATYDMSNLIGGWTKLNDGAGGFMQISVTPRYNCWWLVSANIMSHGYNGGWQRWDWGIAITPADVEGISQNYRQCTQCYDNSTVEWRSKGASYMFRLAGGTAYTAYLAHVYSSGYYQRYYTGPIWSRILGRLISEGVL